MANLLQNLIPMLCLLGAAASSQGPPSSTSFYYQFYCPAPYAGLTFQGYSGFPLSSPFLRLTHTQNEIVGRVLYTNPVQFWQTGAQIDFDTSITFLISNNPGKFFADGIAFFIAPVGSCIPDGSTGGNLGVFESSGNGPGVFAVEFDTFANNGWDPEYRHIGIDIGSRVSSNTTFVGDAMVMQLVTANISYKAVTKVISVALSAGNQTFEVSYEYDLSGLLPQQVQVGLSASTGEESAAHDIMTWYFASTMVNTGAATKSRKQLIRPFV